MGKVTIIPTTPVNLTAEQLNLINDAVRKVHESDRIGHSLNNDAVLVLSVIGEARDRLAAARQEREDFLASITDEEIEYLRRRR